MEPEIETFSLAPDGDIPNNPLPLVLYRHALAPELRTASGCQALFARNLWPGNWVDGIFDYWHFHLPGHEVLGCIAGLALPRADPVLGPQGPLISAWHII